MERERGWAVGRTWDEVEEQQQGREQHVAKDVLPPVGGQWRDAVVLGEALLLHHLRRSCELCDVDEEVAERRVGGRGGGA